MKNVAPRAFSLVEVAVALAIIAFGLLTVFALLPLGLQSNKISADESRASMILSLVEADLQNSYSRTGESLIFGLPLPYSVDAKGRRLFNNTLTASENPAGSIGLDEAENPVSLSSTPRPHYQVSVFYQNLPARGDLASMQARIVVSWPAQSSASGKDLTQPGKVSGFVESFVSFPAP